MKMPRRARPVYTKAYPLELTNAVARLPSRPVDEPVPRKDRRGQKSRGAGSELEGAVQDTSRAV
jgi:hypothetical protein